MERRVRFEVTDYDPSSPINQISSKNNSENAKEHVITRVNIHEDSLEEQRKRIASVCDELKRLKSYSAMRNPTRYRSKSTAVEFLKGMKMFIVPIEGNWTTVERRFDKMTADTSGMLVRSKFSECVVRIKMKITQDEVKKFISLIATANNMSIIENKADEYVAQIMEEFDLNEFGYITLEDFKMLLKELETQNVTSTEETEKPTTLNRKPLKRWYKVIEAISSSSLILHLKKRPSTK